MWLNIWILIHSKGVQWSWGQDFYARHSRIPGPPSAFQFIKWPSSLKEMPTYNKPSWTNIRMQLKFSFYHHPIWIISSDSPLLHSTIEKWKPPLKAEISLMEQTITFQEISAMQKKPISIYHDLIMNLKGIKTRTHVLQGHCTPLHYKCKPASIIS